MSLTSRGCHLVSERSPFCVASATRSAKLLVNWTFHRKRSPIHFPATVDQRKPWKALRSCKACQPGQGVSSRISAFLAGRKLTARTCSCCSGGGPIADARRSMRSPRGLGRSARHVSFLRHILRTKFRIRPPIRPPVAATNLVIIFPCNVAAETMRIQQNLHRFFAQQLEHFQTDGCGSLWRGAWRATRRG